MKEKKKKVSKTAKKKELQSKAKAFSNEEEEAVFKLRELLRGRILEEIKLDSSSVKNKKHNRPQRGEEKIKYQSSDITCWAKRLILCLRRSIACHRWNDAAKLLFALTYQPDRTSEVIWMAGFQIFCNHPKSTPELLQEFSNTMSSMDKLYHPVIALENTMVCLGRNDFSEAQKALARVEGYKKISEDKLNSKQKHISLIMQGYRAMFDYAMWKTVKDEIDEKIQNGEDLNETSEAERDRLASTAIQLFEDLFQHSGVWDIFISKYIALMKYYEKDEQLINVLQNYCKMNPLHANCYVYLYDALRQHRPNDHERLSYILKRLSFVDPSNKRLLDLPDYWREKDTHLVLESTFNMLDYTTWKNNNSLWQLLAELLLSMHRLPLKSEFEKLGELWKDRAIWWPSYHFQVKHIIINSEETAELAVNKALAYCSLGGADNEYTKVVLKKLSPQFRNHRATLINRKRILESLDVSDEDSDNLENNDKTSNVPHNGEPEKNRMPPAKTNTKTTKSPSAKKNLLFQISDESDSNYDMHSVIENCIKSLNSPVKKAKVNCTKNREAAGQVDEDFRSKRKVKKKKRAKDKFENGTSNGVQSYQSLSTDVIQNSQCETEKEKKTMCDMIESSSTLDPKKLSNNRLSHNSQRSNQTLDSFPDCSNKYSLSDETGRSKKKRKRHGNENSSVIGLIHDNSSPKRKKARQDEVVEDFTKDYVDADFTKDYVDADFTKDYVDANDLGNGFHHITETNGKTDLKSERDLFDYDVWTQEANN